MHTVLRLKILFRLMQFKNLKCLLIFSDGFPKLKVIQRGVPQFIFSWSRADKPPKTTLICRSVINARNTEKRTVSLQ